MADDRRDEDQASALQPQHALGWRAWPPGRPRPGSSAAPASKSSSVMRSSSVSRVMPALATRTSTGPWCSSTAANAASSDVRVGDVGLHARSTPAGGSPDAVGDGHVVAELHEGLGDLPADPSVAACDEHRSRHSGSRPTRCCSGDRAAAPRRRRPPNGRQRYRATAMPSGQVGSDWPSGRRRPRGTTDGRSVVTVTDRRRVHWRCRSQPSPMPPSRRPATAVPSYAAFRMERILGSSIRLRDAEVEGINDSEDVGFSVRVDRRRHLGLRRRRRAHARGRGAHRSTRRSTSPGSARR